ncbi:hypothetical protein HUJ05_002157 [Dendroctonus ponderosae]|nr:hypothetical protein HUJ05_002157 [Dendroctonus ponderosae]
MKAFILASLLIVAVGASLENFGSTFQSFKLKHSKNYSNQVEEAKRLAIFTENFREIEEHNALYAAGLVSYNKSVNQFTDLTIDEFKAYLTLHSKPTLNTVPYVRTGLQVPTTLDWRSHGYVTGVKDQGDCGSCWAFSILVSLSEQQLIDCTTNINAGCDGGYLEETFPYVQQTGLVSESSYPYTERDGNCKFSVSDVVAKVSKYVLVSGEADLLEAVGSVGPVSVAMDASYIYSYASGVYETNLCAEYSLNHGVLVVGYGTQDGKDYWLIKNSWGSTWGEQGYLKLLRGKNECGIAEDDVYPII